ncbi:MAG: hypothetical protein J7K31_01040 [Candidatus Aenigmarchaeota archaeon]|nr:hypothetical protein [Candidatus Aenigmarchaeota archaeon]
MKIAKSFFVLVALLAMTTIALGAETVEVGAGATPGDSTPTICVKDRAVTVNGVNILNYRTGLYAFTGETIVFDVAVRDPNGAADIGQLKIQVEGNPEVLCTEISFSDFDGDPPRTCDGLGTLSHATDKTFRCTLTVEPGWYDDSEVKMTVYNSAFVATDGTHTENWFFNPAISMSVVTSDGLPIHFEDGQPGDWVHSLNKLQIKNIAEGGVNLWMWIAGTDLTDPNGASLCPDSNVLRLHEDAGGDGLDTDGLVEANSDDTGMAFRGWTGTIMGPWTWMSNYDDNAACNNVLPNTATGTCYGGKPVPKNTELNQGALGNLLTNQGTLEIEFKLHYPVPCIGTFSDGTIYIIAKAV